MYARTLLGPQKNNPNYAWIFLRGWYPTSGISGPPGSHSNMSHRSSQDQLTRAGLLLVESEKLDMHNRHSPPLGIYFISSPTRLSYPPSNINENEVNIDNARLDGHSTLPPSRTHFILLYPHTGKFCHLELQWMCHLMPSCHSGICQSAERRMISAGICIQWQLNTK